MKAIITGVAAVWLAACSSPEQLSEAVGVDPAKANAGAGETAQEALERRLAVGAKATEFKDEEKSGEVTRDFSYGWPAQVSAVSALAEIMAARRDNLLAKQKAEWKQSLAEFAGMDCVTCVTRSYSKGWKVAADTPRFLALRASIATYSGGAHGNSFFDSLVWDREAEQALAPIELFSSEAALDEALRNAYCAGLQAERMERISPGLVRGTDPLESCPSLGELVLVLSSSTGSKLDQLDLLAAPYIAGSYAEGAYEVALPVTDAILAAVKPEYRAAFALGEVN
ncbi:MAG: DUF4163 domain-containing protein [Pseudomonadota bacterium]